MTQGWTGTSNSSLGYLKSASSRMQLQSHSQSLHRGVVRSCCECLIDPCRSAVATRSHYAIGGIVPLRVEPVSRSHSLEPHTSLNAVSSVTLLR